MIKVNRHDGNIPQAEDLSLARKTTHTSATLTEFNFINEGIGIGTAVEIPDTRLHILNQDELTLNPRGLDAQDLTKLYIAFAYQNNNPNIHRSARDLTLAIKELAQVSRINTEEQNTRLTKLLNHTINHLTPNFFAKLVQVNGCDASNQNFHDYVYRISDLLVAARNDTEHTVNNLSQALAMLLSPRNFGLVLNTTHAKTNSHLISDASKQRVQTGLSTMVNFFFLATLVKLQEGHKWDTAIRLNLQEKEKKLLAGNDLSECDSETKKIILEYQSVARSLLFAGQQPRIPSGDIIAFKRNSAPIGTCEIGLIVRPDNKLKGVLANINETDHLNILICGNSIPCLAPMEGQQLQSIQTGNVLVIAAIDSDTSSVVVCSDKSELALWQARELEYEANKLATQNNINLLPANNSVTKVAWIFNSPPNKEQQEFSLKSIAHVGLVRTELLVAMDKELLSSSKKRIATYESFLNSVSSQANITFRLFDYSHPDKIGDLVHTDPIDSWTEQIKELTQLAKTKNRPIQILLPMVDDLETFEKYLSCFKNALGQDLEQSTLISIGIQIESQKGIDNLPVIFEKYRQFIGHVAIGTNDLSIDVRPGAHERNSTYKDHFDPSLLRAILQITDAVAQENESRGKSGLRQLTAPTICGEMGAQPILAPFFIAAGIGYVCTPLSAENYKKIVDSLNAVDPIQAAELLDTLINLPDSAAVKRVLDSREPNNNYLI